MRIEKLSSKKFTEWNNFVDQYEGQVTIAHNPVLGSIIEKTFGFSDESLLVYDGGELVSVFPCCRVGNKAVSMPHFSYGGALVADEEKTEEVYALITEYLDSEFEIRSFQKVSKEYNDEKVTAFLKLKPSEEEQMVFFDRDKRNEIKKGFKEGIESEVGGIELLDKFYVVYSDIMHRLGSPVLTRFLFSNILESYKFGEAKLFINYYENKPISSSIIMSYKNFVEVPWAASLWEFSKLGANNLLYWNMISYSIRQGYDIFSFGRCTKGSGSHSFKKKWGTYDKQLYFNINRKSNFNVKSLGFLADIWAKIPKPVADRVGPFFSKRIY